MKTIYLLRHFKVKDTISNRLNSQDFEVWVDAYDTFDLEYRNVDLPAVKNVYVSSQNRAVNTAKHLGLEYEITDLLREVEAKPFISTKKWKFSKSFWLIHKFSFSFYP